MPRESGDRTLYYFGVNVRQYVADIENVGFDDLEELRRKLDGIREEIETLERKAELIADEQAERMADLEPHDFGWTAAFNRGGN